MIYVAEENKLNESAIAKYIEERLAKFSHYSLTEDDINFIEKQGKSEFILKKLLLKNFRKSKVHEDTRNAIKQKIAMSIEKNIPIHLIICFGGYKHFWNPSHPTADWAEFFNLKFMEEIVSPILAVHAPGVILDYESEDVIIPWMDNYSEQDMDEYAGSFRHLINVLSKSYPQNFKINYIRSQEQYNTQLLFDGINERLPQKIKEWCGLSDEEKNKRLKRSPNSIKWQGKKDLTNMNDDEKEKKIQMSKMLNELYYEVDFLFRKDYFEGENHIPLVLSWGLSDENVGHWVVIGSTRASQVDFWIGRGILEYRSGKFIERVLSKKQYDSIKSGLKKFRTEGITFKNFKEIEVYEGFLDLANISVKQN